MQSAHFEAFKQSHQRKKVVKNAIKKKKKKKKESCVSHCFYVNKRGKKMAQHKAFLPNISETNLFSFFFWP